MINQQRQPLPRSGSRNILTDWNITKEISCWLLLITTKMCPVKNLILNITHVALKTHRHMLIVQEKNWFFRICLHFLRRYPDKRSKSLRNAEGPVFIVNQ